MVIFWVVKPRGLVGKWMVYVGLGEGPGRGIPHLHVHTSQCHNPEYLHRREDLKSHVPEMSVCLPAHQPCLIIKSMEQNLLEKLIVAQLVEKCPAFYMDCTYSESEESSPDAQILFR
jgi:hypothetical protein